MLPSRRPVFGFLEGVGTQRHDGSKVPFIAVPTTAGTGSEATKNAVLSVRGEQGYKKSFRHEALVARVAVVDPDLLDTCPRELMATRYSASLTTQSLLITAALPDDRSASFGFS